MSRTGTRNRLAWSGRAPCGARPKSLLGACARRCVNAEGGAEKHLTDLGFDQLDVAGQVVRDPARHSRVRRLGLIGCVPHAEATPPGRRSPQVSTRGIPAGLRGWGASPPPHAGRADEHHPCTCTSPCVRALALLSGRPTGVRRGTSATAGRTSRAFHNPRQCQVAMVFEPGNVTAACLRRYPGSGPSGRRENRSS